MKVEADSHEQDDRSGGLTEDELDILRAEDEGMLQVESPDDESTETLREDIVQGGTPG